MKLSGNKRNGRYATSNQQNMAPKNNKSQEEQYVGPRAAKAAAKRMKARRARRVLTAVLIIIVALAAVLYCVYTFGVTPPPYTPPKPNNPATDTAVSDGESPVSFSSDRKSEYDYTFAILGFDDDNGNTDTIMVANFDATNHTLSVVNIPRDTLVNVSWNTKKINTLYANGGVEGVTNGLSNILGFQVDFYVMVDLKAFIELVDAVGGVDFDVPVDMDYDDPSQDLSIHYKAGIQHLDGQEAMEVVRFRKGYPDADIGRIGTQQDFLLTAAKQILAKQNQLDLTELAGIFIKYVDTDLNLGNLVWLGKEFYKMDAVNITFETMPANYGDSVNHSSYVTIYTNDWLKLLNEKINPYKQEMTAKDLSILTRDQNGSLYVTNGVWAGKKSWGSGGSSSDSTGSPAVSEKPSAEPSPSPSSEPSPSDSASPSPSVDILPSPSGEDSSPDISPTETGGDASPSPTPSSDPSPSPSSP